MCSATSMGTAWASSMAREGPPAKSRPTAKATTAATTAAPAMPPPPPPLPWPAPPPGLLLEAEGASPALDVAVEATTAFGSVRPDCVLSCVKGEAQLSIG